MRRFADLATGIETKSGRRKIEKLLERCDLVENGEISGFWDAKVEMGRRG